MKIYVASSWRNDHQQGVVAALRQVGHEAYDFHNPAPGDTGFGWKEIDPGFTDWTVENFRSALATAPAVRGFGFDRNACEWADAGVLVLPSGRSSHLEAGWMSGRGKPVVIYAPVPVEPELMYKFFDEEDGSTPVYSSLVEVFAALKWFEVMS